MARKWTASGAAKYWNRLFNADTDSEYLVLERADLLDRYWVSPKLSRDESKDIGPFDTFEAAAACFETLVGLD